MPIPSNTLKLLEDEVYQFSNLDFRLYRTDLRSFPKPLLLKRFSQFTGFS